MGRKLKTSVMFAVGSLILLLPANAGSVRYAEWSEVSSARYGFKMAYPSSVFTTDGGKISEDGQVLVSRDGKAKLIIGAFANDDSMTLLEYRAQILEQNYAGADLDFAPVRATYFVVSGTVGDRHFYERVSFTCGGRLINSWALLYSVDTRETYDSVIDAMAGTYAPGRGLDACQ